MRPLIAILLLAALATGGCDRQSPGAQQPNASAPVANSAATAETKGLDRTHKGEAAPAFAFTGPAGKKLTLASFAGKPVLLNLWATWCAPCVKEMPTLDALARAKGDALQVLTISQDFKPEPVAKFFTSARFEKIQPYLDTDTAFSIGLGVNLPTTILYDSTGKEVWRISGDLDWTSPAAAALVAEAK